MDSCKSKIDITVCIITCNHEPYIAQSILSVLSQTNRYRMEILVGVDESNDATLELVRQIASQFPSIVKYRHHQPRLGCGSHNFHTLLKEARGKYIAYLDGDDYWLPGKLEMQLNAFEQDQGIIACYTNAMTLNEKGIFTGEFTNYCKVKVSIETLITKGNFLNFSSLIFKRDVLSYVLSVTPPFIDFQVNLILSQIRTVAFITKPLVVYRFQTPSSMRKTKNDHVREKYWTALKFHLSPNISQPKVLASTSVFLRSVFFHSIRTGNIWMPVGWFKRALKEMKINPWLLLLFTIREIVSFPAKAIVDYVVKKRQVLYRV